MSNVSVFDSPNDIISYMKYFHKILVIKVKCIGCMQVVIHNTEKVIWKAENGILIIEEGKDKKAKFPIKMIEEIVIKYKHYADYKTTQKLRVSGLYARSLLSDDALQCLREFEL